MVANHVFVQNNAAMLAVPVEERENFWHKLVKFYEAGQQDNLNDFLYKTSIGIMPGGLTMEKTRRSRKETENGWGWSKAKNKQRLG
ncbi:hypothetical protein ACXO9C_05890 [Lactobacillus delbrueckii subsp. bulgaricus]